MPPTVTSLHPMFCHQKSAAAEQLMLGSPASP